MAQSVKRRVALFVTCLVDQVAPEVGQAAVRLLEAAGCEVVFPSGQTCCGQPAYNAGFPDDARRLARHHVDVFAPYDTVVTPSGSCAAMVRHFYPKLLGADTALPPTFELTEFLVDELARPDLGARVDATVTYHASCHLLRELGVADAPRAVLDAAGVKVSDMADPERCCGFGGTFSVTHPEMSVPMADAKLDQAVATGAPTLVACDTGCLLHLRTRAAARGLDLGFRHVAEVISGGLEK